MLGHFRYVRPTTLEAASRQAIDGGEAAVFLAGGTDLLVQIRNRVRTPSLVIDLKGIPEVQHMKAGASGGFTIGAAVPLNVVVEDRHVRGRAQGLSRAAQSIATYQLRNRATLGGNLCNASPAADMAPILLALGATAVVSGAERLRRVPVHDLFAGVKRTTLARGEILREVEIPIPDGLRTTFRKQQRIRGHDLAVASVAGAYDPGTRIVRIAIGSCGPVPAILPDIEARGVEETANEAVRCSESCVAPIDDVRATAVYRHAVLPVLIRRVVADLLQPERGASHA